MKLHHNYMREEDYQGFSDGERASIALEDLDALACELTDYTECDMSEAGSVDAPARMLVRVSGRAACIIMDARTVLQEEIERLQERITGAKPKEPKGNGDVNKSAAPEPPVAPTPSEEAPAGAGLDERIPMLIKTWREARPESTTADRVLADRIQGDLDCGLSGMEIVRAMKQTSPGTEYETLSGILREERLRTLREKQEAEDEKRERRLKQRREDYRQEHENQGKKDSPGDDKPAKKPRVRIVDVSESDVASVLDAFLERHIGAPPSEPERVAMRKHIREDLAYGLTVQEITERIEKMSPETEYGMLSFQLRVKKFGAEQDKKRGRVNKAETKKGN